MSDTKAPARADTIKGEEISFPGVAFATLAALFLLLANPLFASDFESGSNAYRSGDFEEALTIWRPLAQAGDQDAQYALGAMYEYGRGLDRDDAKAAYWYLKAAQQNLSDAQYRLGVLRENGWGVERDATRAAHWYEQAARADHALAQHDLAFMYFHGTGVPHDKVMAYMWLKIASVQRADLMTKHLAVVSRTMSHSEIAKAEYLARAWLNAQKI